MKGLGRYLRLFLVLFKFALMRQMAYRSHFLLMIFGKIARMALLLFFFQSGDTLCANSREHLFDYRGDLLLLFSLFF